MTKKASTSTPVKRKFFFPEHGVTIEAETLGEATKQLSTAKTEAGDVKETGNND